MFRSLFKLVLAFAVPFILTTRTNAESHTIKFVNQCGFGSPALMYNGKNILTGDTYTSNGPWSGIAYLQNGYCNVNGENCTLLETTLINPTCVGCGSSTDISLIPPHVYSVETSFAYYNGCDGIGQTCNAPNCPTAFFTPNDNYVQVACQTDNVNLLVSFCAPASQFISKSNTSSPSTTSPVATMPTTTTSPSPTSTHNSTPGSTPGTSPTSTPSSAPTPSPSTTSSVSSTTSSPTTALASSKSTGLTTPSSASSPSPFSASSTSTPTTPTPTKASNSSITTSTPGALNVSPTTSDIGASNPTGTNTAPRCRPRTSSNSPIPTPTTPATGGSTPPKQCGAPSPTSATPLRHRRSRHAAVNIAH